jgi:threonine dehydrogenase-like Zn-dependent dehydrogenase
LWCKPRGFDDLCEFCARGEINRCERTTRGDLASGLITGACRDTGGSWSPYFLAHRSQLYSVPEAISDENALMIEPFAVSLHAVLQNYPADDRRVLIIGAGSIGLCTLAALRGLGSRAEILVLARYGFQADAARRLGASKVIKAGRGGEYYEELAEFYGGSVHKPIIGKRIVLGGAGYTFECVGSDSSLDDALRFTRAGGRVVLVGVPGIAKGVDWTAIFAQELEVKAAYAYHHAERFGGKRLKTFDLAIDLMATGKVDLGWMVTHKFPLEDYREAFDLTHRRGGESALKIAFEFSD